MHASDEMFDFEVIIHPTFETIADVASSLLKVQAMTKRREAWACRPLGDGFVVTVVIDLASTVPEAPRIGEPGHQAPGCPGGNCCLHYAAP